MVTSDDDEDAGVAATPAAPFNTQQALISGLLQRGVSPQAAYGVVGSFMGESGKSLNAKAVNPGDGADGSNSIGFGQWNGQRAKNLQATAASMSLPATDPSAQVAHYFNEIDGKYPSGNETGYLANLQNASTVAQGNDIHTQQYERPANPDAQVAARLANGNLVAQSAASGTTGFQVPTQPPGALSSGSVAGMDLGALYRMAQNAPPPEEGIGEHMQRFGAALAGISNPGQAQAILAGIPKQPQQQNQAAQLIQALQLQQAIKQGNAPTPIKTMVAPNGNGYITMNPDGTPGQNYTPYPVAAQTKDDAPVLNAKQEKNFQDASFAAYGNQAAIDDVASLKQQLASDPSIASYLGFTANTNAWIDNSQGKSTAASQFVKNLNAALESGVIAISSGLPSKSQNIIMQAREKTALAPNGSLNDPVTTYDVLNRLQDRSKTIYTSAMNNLQGAIKKVGPIPFQDPSTGQQTTPDDYHAANIKRWDNADDKSEDAYSSILKPNHDIKMGITKPVTRIDQILNHFGM